MSDEQQWHYGEARGLANIAETAQPLTLYIRDARPWGEGYQPPKWTRRRRLWWAWTSKTAPVRRWIAFRIYAFYEND